MLAFSEKVLERGFSGTGPVYTSVDTYERLARADRWFIQARVAQAAGTSPTLSVALEHSADGETWTSISTPISSVAVTIGSVTDIFGAQTATPSGRLVRLRVVLGGTSTSAFVQVWVAGRARRAASR